MNSNCTIKYSVNEIIDAYKKQYNIDISEIFSKSIDSIDLCFNKKEDIYYFNPQIEGSKNYYNDLSKLPWYYMDSKWEFSQALNQLSGHERILEIGSGNGSFIKYARNRKFEAIGLEPNYKGNSSLPEVLPLSFDDYIINNNDKYDVICSFQVLEHIKDPMNLIQKLVDRLDSGSKLILSLPNEDGFLKLDKFNLLNMPPHHLTLWTEKGFKKIADKFDLNLIYFNTEYLQDYHKKYYRNLVIQDIKKRFFKADKNLPTILFKVIDSYLFIKINYFSKWIKGHTMIGVFEKK